jgi:hypothetical protein
LSKAATFMTINVTGLERIERVGSDNGVYRHIASA